MDLNDFWIEDPTPVWWGALEVLLVDARAIATVLVWYKGVLSVVVDDDGWFEVFGIGIDLFGRFDDNVLMERRLWVSNCLDGC